MKKLLVLIIAIAMVSSIYAADMNPATNNAFAKVSTIGSVIDARTIAMGGAGLADANNYQSLWNNPARLGEKNVQFSLPAVGITLYNTLEIAKSLPESGDVDTDTIINAALNSLTTGYGKIVDMDAQVSFTAGGFGLGLSTKNSIYTYAPLTSSGGVNSKFYDAMSVNALVGYGRKFNLNDLFSVSVGASVGASALIYTDLIGASNLTSILNSDEAINKIIDKTPLAFGYSIPVKAALALDMPLGFSISTVAKINNAYSMYYAENKSAFENENASFDEFKIDVPFTIDAGAAWSINFLGKFLRPVIAVDVVDVVGLVQSKDFSKENLFKHVKAGAEIRGLWILDVRAGLNEGYWTAGAAVDLGIINLEAAYHWQEMGANLGQKGVDALTIKANIGW